VALGKARSISLQNLQLANTTVPVMVPMPPSQPYFDLADSLESIPKYSWILPYVLTCCPPQLLGQLRRLPFLIEGMSYEVKHGDPTGQTQAQKQGQGPEGTAGNAPAHSSNDSLVAGQAAQSSATQTLTPKPMRLRFHSHCGVLENYPSYPTNPTNP
ncbi:hypothetical protein B484DRAFT_438086, partial [Ochromonadaceae sp. CCMP2298]